ncbi:MAG: molybdopterin-dependent oxidoreductase [Chloroflexi bacterium]|nr:molybdopterin-dependent oxidoreductase [Chloroflexota bacterium]
MSQQISRRDFLKLAGVGAATTAVLTGCGPASRYVTRAPYIKMPEYTYNGLSTFYATTCRECSAGCGLVIRTMQGRAIKVEGNPDHPVNLGKTCARGQATLHGLYNPDRITDPIQRVARGSEGGTKMDWEAAIGIVADALSKNKPDEIAFLVGMAPDHLFDLVADLAKTIGAPAPVRFGALGMFEARTTLVKAAEETFGQTGLPFFDIGGADLVISFGANFLETWLSPVAQTREFSKMRRGQKNKRGYLVQFESRMSQTGAKADEWIPITPGTEAMVALAIGRLIVEARGLSLPPAFANVDVNGVVEESGVTLDTLNRVAGLFSLYDRPLVIPGGGALGLSNGLQTAEAALALNALAGNFGKNGGVFISPANPLADQYHRPASGREMQDFIQRMFDGKVKVLFVHGVNPLFELPKKLGFGGAMKYVPQIISFATFPDETAMEADYVFPDHHGLESWGYQKIATGSASSVLSGAQPVVVPFFNTKSTVDVLLAAAQKAGGALASAFPFKDEVEFMDSKLDSLLNVDGFFSAPEINTFAAYFQQYGGWWKTTDNRIAPSSADVLNRSFKADAAQFDGQGDFFFVPFVSPILGEAGANKPWLQEVPDPTTTIMWNTWVEINPATADKLGIEDNDVVRVVSDYGEVEVSVYKYPAIRPDTIAMPFGQGHTAYGQFAQGRGANPADLFGPSVNEAGDLAFGSLKVRIEKTSKKRQLSRLEGVLGVYGFDSK